MLSWSPLHVTAGLLHPYDLHLLMASPVGKYPSLHEVVTLAFIGYCPFTGDPCSYSSSPLDTSGLLGQFAVTEKIELYVLDIKRQLSCDSVIITLNYTKLSEILISNVM